MNIESIAENNSPLQNEQIITSRSCNKTLLQLIDESAYGGALNALKVHLEKSQLEQHVLDICLLYGLEIVTNLHIHLTQVAPTLQLLLLFGAQWKDGILLKYGTTPYHLICQCPGDHYKLLDLMFTSSDGALIDAEDDYRGTALWYAAQNANINCIRSLITNGARIQISPIDGICPLCVTITNLQPGYTYGNSRSIMTDIFDLLLVNCEASEFWSVTINYAIDIGVVECVIKLILKTSQLNIHDKENLYCWWNAARLGNIDLLKCMLNNGIGKDCTDKKGGNLLTWVAKSGNVEAVRYVLDLGVTVSTYVPTSEFEVCKVCGGNILLDADLPAGSQDRDPSIAAIHSDAPAIAQLLAEHGSLLYSSIHALVLAIRCSSVNMVEYLLKTYTYNLNIEYVRTKSFRRVYGNVLTEKSRHDRIPITKLLLAHGADPNKKICGKYRSSDLIDAIFDSCPELIALYIRNGVDINLRSKNYDNGIGHFILPFEASVLHDVPYVAEMLLVSGCSCGVFSLGNNHEYTDAIKSIIEDLMKKWNVHKNNVIPLKMQCRRMILNHLSPQADNKIKTLPLPPSIITYLSIPELDDILDVWRNSKRYYYSRVLPMVK